MEKPIENYKSQSQDVSFNNCGDSLDDGSGSDIINLVQSHYFSLKDQGVK